MPALGQVEGLPAGLLKVSKVQWPAALPVGPLRHLEAMGRGWERCGGRSGHCREAYAHLQDYGTMILGITVKYHEQRSGSKQ